MSLQSTENKLLEKANLEAQLLRQLHVAEKYNIKAHKIKNILLKPTGRNTDSSIKYSSLVTMKNGNEIFINNVNIKKLLDTGEEQ